MSIKLSKNLEDFLKENNVYEKAINYCIARSKEAEITPFNYTYRWLGAMFVFSSTVEGVEFWKTLSMKQELY